MTKEEYIQWKATRGEDAAKWDYQTCVEADELIKRAALSTLSAILFSLGVKYEVRSFVCMMAKHHYGTVEVDEFLISLYCYPIWA
jgi:hypothetical protein